MFWLNFNLFNDHFDHDQDINSQKIYHNQSNRIGIEGYQLMAELMILNPTITDLNLAVSWLNRNYQINSVDFWLIDW